MITDLETPRPAYLEEEKITEECKDLISSLPREKGWVTSYFFQYQGFWHPRRQLQGLLNCQKHFQAEDNDIILVTNPKAGTTWLKALIFALVNRQIFQDSQEQHPLLTNSPHILIPFLELGLYYGTHIPDLSVIPFRRVFGTHLPLVSLPESIKNSSCKIVYCYRNPKDTFVSLWHFANKMKPKEMKTLTIEDAFDKFCRGRSPYGPFWDHALEYWKESQSQESLKKVLFVKYEEIKEQPAIQLKRLAHFLDCPFSEEEEGKGTIDDIIKLCSFDTLSNLEANRNGKLPIGVDVNCFFRKGDTGGWKVTLNASMAEEMDRITEEKFCDSDLKFDS